MKNKILSLLLSLVLVFSVAGCGTVKTELADTPTVTDYETAPDVVETVEETPVAEETPVVKESPALSVTVPEIKAPAFSSADIPAYSGKAYVAINGNLPYFTESEHTTTSFEKYSALDSMGRCGVAFANIGVDIMPTEDRGSIGSVKPSGWQTIKYDIVDGKYLYNRCHLIGFQLSGENANAKNLITGTRSMNVDGMLPFENMIADYVSETKNHVLYRVTPIYDGNNLLATGILMEALSMEDDGEGICFNVFCYNEQPGIEIDHANGSSRLKSPPAPKVEEKPAPKPAPAPAPTTHSYIANRNTKKFHYPDCYSVDRMNEENKVYLNCTRSDAIDMGYDPCGNCDP